METDDAVLAIGLAGSAFATVRLIPQVYRSLTTAAAGMSITTLLLDLASCVMFLIYAVHFRAWPFVISNVVSGIAALVLIGVALRKRIRR